MNNEPIHERYALWDQFLQRFPLEKVESMRLEQYSQVGSKECFTWWLESGLDSLGSIWGSTAFKFGIYARKNTEKEYKNKRYKSNDQYAWLAKYGDTADEAFGNVKNLIITVIQAARAGDIGAIKEVDLSTNYKWKLAHTYQNRNQPIVLNIFTKEVLAHFLQAKEVSLPPKPDLPLLYREVMRFRDKTDLLEFGDKVWKEGSALFSYTTLKTNFFKYFKKFTTFTSAGEDYLQEERNYKQELCDIYAQEIGSRLHPLPVDGNELLQLGKDIASLLTRKLASENNRPQNLVGWRYVDSIKNLQDDGLRALARAVSRLTAPGADLAVTIPDFVGFLHQYSPEGKCPQAATRSLTTFFLFLSDPGVHFFIKTEEVSKLLKLFQLDTFKNDSLAPEEYKRVQLLAREIFDLLKEDGLEPRDMIDVQSFMWSAIYVSGKEEDMKAVRADSEEPVPQAEKTPMTPYPLNQILYGPPGTGKTYITAERAVRICDGKCPDDRTALMQRYRALLAEKRISFVSFHQSFSYEEFIEGIRPDLTGQTESGQEQLIYRIEDGLFKKVCSLARTAVADLQRPQAAGISLAGKNFYKMSVGGKYDPEVESFCFEHDYLALGWGGDVDFSTLPKEKKWEPSSKAIRELMAAGKSEHAEKRYAVQAIYWFKNEIDIGDIVIIPRGLQKVQAIGQVTGEYEYKPELLPGLGYEHVRTVQWLVKDADIPVEKILSKQFSQQTIYSLNPAYLNTEYLEKLLGGIASGQAPEEAERYVLIIDEINRANISKVLGELITLIEPDKRLGMINEVTVKLPYSREEFGIPANLHIVGTMNTADRSLAMMDTALRRRFEFEEMMPQEELLQSIEVGEIKIRQILRTINQRIEALYDREHTIGHAFFLPLEEEPSIENLASIFEHKIIPLLAEYFFEDWQKIRLVLGDNQKTEKPEAQFILEEELENNGSILFGNSTDLALYGLDRVHQYVRNTEALTNPDAYIGIYDSAALSEE